MEFDFSGAWPFFWRYLLRTRFLKFNRKNIFILVTISPLWKSIRLTGSRSVYCKIRSTLVICCMVSVAWRMPYWTIPVKINACDMARPTFPLNVSRPQKVYKMNYFKHNKKWRRLQPIEGHLLSYKMIKLNVTQATNAVLTQSIQSPQAVFDDIANCHTALWTSCNESNSWVSSFWILRARIVPSPFSEAVKWEKTGLRPAKNPFVLCNHRIKNAFSHQKKVGKT